MSLLQDPFYVVKDEVQQSVGGITALYDRWHELIKTPQTTMAHVDELKWTTNQLRTGINSIERDILDLEETIGIVENNRQKFRLDQAELDSRKKFISEIKYVLKKMKDELQSVTAKGKITNNERGALMKNTSNGKYAALDRVIQEDNEAFIRNQQQVQEQIIKEQDTELEQISQTVDTMKHMGDAIYVELNSQNKILEDLDSGVDSTHGRLLAVSRRVTNLLNSRSDNVYAQVINSTGGTLCQHKQNWRMLYRYFYFFLFFSFPFCFVFF
eukprot:Phypoly_transcript_12127.p1 GENE.Phypoly_transcript_12127~~Phypoly_transcript_12127.p1  ORF type:complete len:270 (+),score=35.86 Phypoly_transcript_12127:86-895(+)